MAKFTIVIPTKDRHEAVKELLDSLKRLRGLARIRPGIMIGDNGSTDLTWEMLREESRNFPTYLEIFQVTTPGKCAVLNEAIRRAKGEVLAFLDDDVVVDESWLEELDRFFHDGNDHVAGQGVIRISALESQDPEIRELLQRYRTIPHLEFARDVGDLHSLNGANIALRREVFDRIGGFDERLGPGASGTSEDVELAQRVRGAGMKIGYMREAIVYHRIDPSRLTEGYFKAIHKRQGASRLLFKQQSSGQILFDLCRVSAQYSFYSIIGNVRDRYRNKGRIYHYLGMLESKLNWKSHD